MFMQIRLPVTCFLILVYYFAFYSRKKRIRTKASYIFMVLVQVAIFHQLAVAVTEYTVNNRDRVPETFNYIWHILFLVSLTCFCSLLVDYILLLIERGTGKRHRVEKIVLMTVGILGVIAQIVLPIEYIDTPQGSYSRGMKAYSLYCVVIIDLLMLLWETIRYKRTLGRAKSSALFLAVIIFAIASVIQISQPYMLLTGPAVTIMMLGLMASTEDMHMYISYKTSLYNEVACREIIRERLCDGKPFQIGVYVFIGEDSVTKNAMLSIEKTVSARKNVYMCGTMADNLLLVLPLFGWRRGAHRIESLPDYDTERKNIQYESWILKFRGAESLENIEKTIRNCKNRYEAEILRRDELTQLLRREAFVQQVNGMIERGESFALIMIDIDDFKRINDTYGHNVGDEVLQASADIFRSVVRSSDVVCRMGGDEFAIALNGTTEREGIEHSFSRMMEKMEKLDVLPDESDTLGLSAGVKTFRPGEESDSFQDIYAKADSALYQVKKSGKHGIAFYGE